jgi:hypothetical protein
VISLPVRLGERSANLIRQIFATDSPEEVVKALPAQAIYLAILQSGLEATSEILPLLPPEHFTILLDFSIWRGDTVDEAQFFDWLTLGNDEEDGILLLKRILQCIDLKILGFLVARYVRVVVAEEATDTPPEVQDDDGVNFYTPDNGFTWIKVIIENQERHFLFSRFLALLYQSSPNLFYKILALPSAATESMLEEEAYTDKVRRLSGEGVPTPEQAEELHSVTLRREALELSKLLQSKKDFIPPENKNDLTFVKPVLPLLYNNSLTPNLRLLRQELNNRQELEDFESSYTVLANHALVFFHTNFIDLKVIEDSLEVVKGIFEIGLELAHHGKPITGESLYEVYSTLSLRVIYQIGWDALVKVRERALKLKRLEKEKNLEPSNQILLDALTRKAPLVPKWFEGESDSTEKVVAISSLRMLERLSSLLKSQEAG